MCIRIFIILLGGLIFKVKVEKNDSKFYFFIMIKYWNFLDM